MDAGSLIFESRANDFYESAALTKHIPAMKGKGMLFSNSAKH